MRADSCAVSTIIVVVLLVLVFIALIVIAALICAVGRYDGGRRDVGARCDGATGGARERTPHRFPRKVCASGRDHPEWNALDYCAFEVAPGNVSWYSSLMPWHVPDVDRALRAEFADAPPRTITDATAHIGADAANFLKVFPDATVTAIEIDPEVGSILRRNATRTARTLGIPASRFRVVVADASLFLREDSQPVADLVYFDPPWAAGRDVLRLGKVELSSAVADVLRRGGRVVFVKVPREMDIDAFDAAVGSTAIRYPVHTGKKLSYYLLAYRRTPSRTPSPN